jgi:hypothetical protein
MQNLSPSGRGRLPAWLWLGPALYMLVAGLYFVGRFGGFWSENDSATLTAAIRAFAAGGRLVPDHGLVYPNGYAYQALATFIMTLTGLDVTTLQQLVFPLTVVAVVLPAWMLYRELTGSARAATLTTMLLFTQPEFLFVILRSSHEKFTRILMLLALYWLVRSLSLHNRPGLFAAHVALFYATTFALITSNNLLAHSFIVAVALALGLGWLLEKRNASLAVPEMLIVRRLTYAVVICLGLVYLFTFYAYQPAEHDLRVLQTAWERLSALFLDVQSRTLDSYSQVEAGWVNLPAYFLVSIANWVVLALSFGIWLRQGFAWLWRREKPASPIAWVLWLFYTAFAVQGALSVVADASGAIGTNLQHRIFPSFSMIAVALVGGELAHWRLPVVARPVRLALALGVGMVGVLSILKATNEPLLSNKWTFYKPTELAALDWADAHLQGAQIWTEFDERLAVTYLIARGTSANKNRFVNGALTPATRDILLTATTELRNSRIRRPLPLPPDALRVYDDGESQIYHLRPLTPYQR